MQSFTIERQGIPNLDFTGELIGQNNYNPSTVKIYRTQAKKYIGQLRANQALSIADGGFDTPQQLFAWFIRNGGFADITPEIQAAIEDATTKDDGIKAAWNDCVQ